MSYYILPKINNDILLDIKCSAYRSDPYISYSLLNYYRNIKQQINFLCSNETDFSYNNFDELIKIVNPYEYVFSKVPGAKCSVSKLKANTIIFYNLLELFNALDIVDSFKNRQITTLTIGLNNDDVFECIKLSREDCNDINLCFESINYNLMDTINNLKFDFIFFELHEELLKKSNDNSSIYILEILKLLLIIFNNLESNCGCVIKIDEIFYKPILDILYILSSIFEKVYIIKPNTSNVTTFEKYIVCKGFNLKKELCSENSKIIYNFLNNNNENDFIENTKIVSLINYDIPYYFMNKLDDINIILGQQQLESLDQIIHIIKNKNKDDKIETIKKTNIQKSVNWCEKYKIPCNKFSEKVNIFLPISKEEDFFEIEDIILYE